MWPWCRCRNLWTEWCDCSIAALEVARERIAVVNPAVPFAYGDLIPLERFTALVKDHRPLITSTYAQPSETDLAIGRHCAELIPDGACLQMGIGAMPNAICACLGGHKHLGLHTEMFSDGALALIRSGVIDGTCKAIDTGKVVASFLLGSQAVYDFIRENDVQLIVKLPAGQEEPQIHDNIGAGPVMTFYLLLNCIGPVFHDLMAILGEKATDQEKLADAMLELVKAAMLNSD